MDVQFGHDGPHGWSRARLLCRLLGVKGPVGFCTLARLLLPGAGKVHPSPLARLVVPRVLCSPKSQMARLVGTVWVTAVRGASRSAEGKGHQSHCHSKVWAPQCLPRHGCLSCRCSVTPAQISPAHLRWQHNPRLVPLIWVLLYGGVSPLCPGGQVAGAGNTAAVGVPASLRPGWSRRRGWLFGCREAKHLCVGLWEVLLETGQRWCEGWKGSGDTISTGSSGPGCPAAGPSLPSWGQGPWQGGRGHFPLPLSRARWERWVPFPPLCCEPRGRPSLQRGAPYSLPSSYLHTCLILHIQFGNTVLFVPFYTICWHNPVCVSG